MKKLLLTLSFITGMAYQAFCGGPSISISIDPGSLFFSAGVSTTTGWQYVTVSGTNYDDSDHTIIVAGSSSSFTPSLTSLFIPSLGSFTSVVGISFTSGTTSGVKLEGSLSFTSNIYIDYSSSSLNLTGAVLPYPSSCVVNVYSDTDVSTGVGTITGNVGYGDLRYCVLLANDAIVPATITFSGWGATILNAGLPDLSNSISLVSSMGTTISGAGQFSIFTNYWPNTLTGENITFMNAYQDEGEGGAIYNEGVMAVNNCNFYNNTASGSGGAIETYGPTVISNCNFLYNQAQADYGGAIQQRGSEGGSGDLYILNSTFAYNSSGSGGSVFDLNTDSTSIVNSTFYGNYTTGEEGTIWSNKPLTFINSTIYNNTNSGYGAIDTYNSVTLINTIVVNNYDLNSEGSINDFTGNIDITAVSSNNISTSSFEEFSDGVNGNIINATIGGSLFDGWLANNGGATWTIAINASSPAFNTGLSVSTIPGITIPGFDQRWLSTFGAKDIGAYEFQGVLQTITGFGPFTTLTLGGVTTVILNATATSGLTVTYSVTGPALLTGNTISVTGAGVVTVTAIQLGNDLYSAVWETQTFLVVPAITGISAAIDPQAVINIYPNPNNGSFAVHSALSTADYQLTDLVGRVIASGVLKAGINQVDMSVGKGIYYLKSGTAVKKVIIE